MDICRVRLDTPSILNLILTDLDKVYVTTMLN